MLPDRSVLIGQKMVENAKCDILSNFQTMCTVLGIKMKRGEFATEKESKSPLRVSLGLRNHARM